MAVFGSDSFAGVDGTLLQDYSVSWSNPAWAPSTGLAISDAGRVRHPAAGASTGGAVHSATPASADYSVSVDLHVVSGVSGQSSGVVGRASASATTYYMARGIYASTTTLNWQLYKAVSGTFTQLGSSSLQTVAAGGTYSLKLDMAGTAIKLFDEGGGTPTVSVTDSAISVVGLAGLRVVGTASNTTGYHLDNFSAEEAGGGLAIAATQGTADASGQIASVNLQKAIAASVATATASGHSAIIGFGSTITATVATADASGYTAAVSLGSTISAGQAIASASGYGATVDRQLAVVASVNTATADGYAADIQLGSDLNINATPATATASGFDALIDRQMAVTASQGAAVASGFDASVASGFVIAASYGLASADGYQAQINLQREIAAGLATATASGFAAVVGTLVSGVGVYPDPSVVLAGNAYGPNGADYVGTLTFAGTLAYPSETGAGNYPLRGIEGVYPLKSINRGYP